jgi:hypothetical protein
VQPFGIDHPEIFIPFTTEGATIYFSLRTPTNEELDHFQFRQIELTNDDEWNLKVLIFHKMVNQKRQFVTNCESDVILMSVSDPNVEHTVDPGD